MSARSPSPTLPRYLPSPGASGLSAKVTVIIPAYNERESIADTITSLQNQTTPPHEIIVVDDCSTDGTGEVARRLGATTIRPASNTGSKAGAQNFALTRVQTELAIAIDADTTLAPDAIEALLPAFADPRVVAACGVVLPRHVHTLWERGRYVEYLLAFSWYKPIQDYYQKPFISSGCFSMYRTNALRDSGGWPTRTLAEDMDLTWRFYEDGHRVRFMVESVCYPIEPHTFAFMRKQLRRWSHGFVQNVKFHWRALLSVRYLRTFVAVTLWDAVFASFTYLLLLPLLAVVFHLPLLLLGYVIDVPVVLVPILALASGRKEVLRALASFPSFFILRLVNGIFLLEAIFTEVLMKRTVSVYEKGH